MKLAKTKSNTEYIKNSYNSTTKNNPIKMWAKYLNRHFSAEDIHMSNEQ